MLWSFLHVSVVPLRDDLIQKTAARTDFFLARLYGKFITCYIYWMGDIYIYIIYILYIIYIYIIYIITIAWVKYIYIC
jgi:fatty acid desaturase